MVLVSVHFLFVFRPAKKHLVLLRANSQSEEL